MGNALISGVAGLKAHQKMLDVTGNNLANVNSLGYKSARVTFTELLSETLRGASQPTGSIGGTNPVQIGSGVALATVDRLMTQGGLVNTGQDLDMAIEGSGYFVLHNGQREVYTRVGSFAVDKDYYLVDPATGYRVQRQGYEGVSEGFQDAAINNIRIPWDVTLAAKPTEHVSFSGKLSVDTGEATKNELDSGITYTASNATVDTSTLLADLDQATDLADGDKIAITGTDCDGNDVTAELNITAATTTLGDLLTAIETTFPGTTASINNGHIKLVDNVAGYSQTNLSLGYTGSGSFELPKYFELVTPGAERSFEASIDIFDSQGIAHQLTTAFVQTDDSQTWDLVIKSVTGGVEAIGDRRISGVSFMTDGSFGGLVGAPPDDQSFTITFSNDPTTPRTIACDFGTIGQQDGVTLSGGQATIRTSGQDGYASGQLSSIAVTSEGVLMGQFDNGLRQEIAAMKLATFQNPSGLMSIGNGYFAASGNSGDPVPVRGLSGGAGAVRGGQLEKSNVEVAAEFVNLIEAQNGFQANARTITVANEILRELSNLIR